MATPIPPLNLARIMQDDAMIAAYADQPERPSRIERAIFWWCMISALFGFWYFTIRLLVSFL